MMSENADLRKLVDANFDDEVRFLAELVKVPSDNPPGDCEPHAMRAAELLEQLDFKVERHSVPAEITRAHGMIAATNLVIRHRFGPGPVIALNAHGDVVPPGAGWTRDPYGAEVVDGWMFGRGVAVSKSDFATYAFALKALKQLNRSLKGTVELHLTYDEEAGGKIGPGWLLKQGISRPDYAIAAGFSYGVVTAHNGCLHLEVEIKGRSAHAARPATGVDALEVANDVMGAIYAYRRLLPSKVSRIVGIGSPQITIGLIEGGINTNVVPDRVTFRLDRRIIPEETPVNVESELRALIEGAVRNFPQAEVEIRRILLANPLVELPGSKRLTDVLCRKASEIVGSAVETCGVPLYTDARHYAEQGIPIVLFGAGPRSIEEANAHRADERLLLSDLKKATEAVAATLSEFMS